MSFINYNSIWKIQHIRDGKVIWEDEKKNSLTQEGAEAFLETFFRNNATYAPTEFSVRVCNYTPSILSTLNSILNEPTTGGYTAQLLERSTTGFPTKDITSGGNYRLTSKIISFTASGADIGTVTNAYMSTTSGNLGKLIAFRSLSMTRTIKDGDTLTLQIKIDLG
jgi:hypothetical protein